MPRIVRRKRALRGTPSTPKIRAMRSALKRRVVKRRPTRARQTQSLPLRLLRANSYYVKVPWIYKYENLSIAPGDAINAPPGFSRAWFPQLPCPGPSALGSHTAGDVVYNGLPYYANFFNNMRVHASTITIRAYNTDNGMFRLVLQALPNLEDSTVNIIGTTQFLNSSYIQNSSMSGAKSSRMISGNASRGLIKLRKHQSTKKLFAINTIRTVGNVTNPTTAAQPMFGASISSSTNVSTWTNEFPSNIWAFALAIYNISSPGSPTVDLDVRIDSYIEFYNPIRVQEQTLV